MKIYKKITKGKLAWGLIAVGVVGLIISGLMMINNNHIIPRGVSLAHAPSSIKPAPQAVASYSVAPSLPKYLDIPSIGVSGARIVGIGLKDGQISNPDNIYDAGWYRASSKPGDAGAMFIFGHISSWTAKGLFYNLNKLKQIGRA